MSEKDIAERLRDAYARTGGNAVGDPFVSQIAREIAAVASGIEARRAETGTGSVHESAAREAGAPIPSLVGEVVEVARLKWSEVTAARSDEDPRREPTGEYEAETPFGLYFINTYFGTDSYGWSITFNGDPISPVDDFDDPDKAKRAAENDYCRRLRAALSAYDAAPRYGVEEIARVIMVADDCGLTVEGERVLCDHPLALGRNENCGCRAAARAVLSLIGSTLPADDRARIRNKALEEAAKALIAASEGEPERWVDVSDDTGQRIGARLEGRTQKLLRGMQAATIVRALKTKD